jgi:hypothetical protein
VSLFFSLFFALFIVVWIVGIMFTLGRVFAKIPDVQIMKDFKQLSLASKIIAICISCLVLVVAWPFILGFTNGD